MAQIPLSDKDREIAARLKQARVDLGYSQAAWASSMGADRFRVVDIERGKGRASDEMLARLMQAHRISSAWLLDGVGSMLEEGVSPMKSRLDRVGRNVQAATDVAVRAGLKGEQARAMQEAAYSVYRTGMASQPPYALDSARLSAALVRVDRFVQRGGDEMPTATRARLIAALYELQGNPADVTDGAIQAVLDVGRAE